jgi:magnesium chelatase family protein
VPGKSMLAQRLPGLWPPLGDDEALDCAMLHSLARPLPPVREWRRPPFRAPHHGASAAAVVGGGGRLRPGEISLAHLGVLFLDELPEYRRRRARGAARAARGRLRQHCARRVAGAIPRARSSSSPR